ncbi:unnamed protein product [Vitrella brassicaformis CCMP3155]|uniref:Sugar phosphate transporter domain-containing protein n=2 Tax=Vitrella brassicaformis TaxID=1169539 RepID=A0A0G4FK17_VITBC|nr:unnamed protein product [Vitrella brassicaformis CCMP3155]|eukprot:CEM14054.1 unnamed protein product [Vitrella brassicaformis CCMP3155]
MEKMPSPSHMNGMNGVPTEKDKAVRHHPPPPAFDLLLGVLCVAGIYVSYSIFSVFQEKIYTIRDAHSGHKFKYGVFLVSCIAFCAFIVGASGLLIEKRLNLAQIRRKINQETVTNFALISLTYVGAMLSSNYALQHVNYPTQVLVKSAKMVPVVVGGFLLFRKTYPWYDYLSVFLVTTSLICFNLFKEGAKKHAVSTFMGVALCFVSLLCDGLTGPRQDHLMKKYHVTKFEHMTFTNLFALVWTALFMFVLEGVAPVTFCINNPSAVWAVLLCASCSALGQIFIFLSLTSFGALYLSLMTTTRKFFTILLSVVLYGHHLNAIQWTSVFVIFAGIFLQTYCKNGDNNKRTKQHGKEAEMSGKITAAEEKEGKNS